jgi:radical SAM PhpK family P-methyltransferase
MPNHNNLDCVLVGYNDMDFAQLAVAQRSTSGYSGAYHEIKTNSVLLDGRRCTYMELMNKAIASATGCDPQLNVFEAPLLGAFYLNHFLRKHGYDAEVVNFFNYNKDKLRTLLNRSPRAVAITTTFYVDHAPIVEIVEFIREHNPRTKIVIGGPHIYNVAYDLDTETQDYVFQHIGADVYVIDSQGESTLARLLCELRQGEHCDLQRVPNLCYTAGDGSFRRTLRVPESNDLDEGTMDWSVFDRREVTPVTYLRTARSCPFTCTFCNYPTLAGPHVVSTVDNVESQLRYLHEIGTTDVVFIDDTFNVPLPRFRELLRMMIRNEFGFRWISFFRCSNADEEVFKLMKESGCVGVLLGIESGDQRILGFMKKSATLERYEWGIRQLHSRGIASFVSLICGFPGETEESVMNTLNFVERTAPTFFNVQLYYHDLRVPIHAQAEQFGIKGAGYSWKHKTMDWREASRWAVHLFNNVHNSIPLTLYGFSLWGISYLLSKGISLERIKKFGELARPLLLKSLDDVSSEYCDYEQQFAELFRGTPTLARSATLLPR